MKTFEFNNIIFKLGQNAKENWEILDEAKQENQDYLWFHLNSFPSPYVIMNSKLSDIEEQHINDILTYAANLCRDYSKYKNYKDIKICYTTVKKIKKTEKIGEIIIQGKKNIIKL